MKARKRRKAEIAQERITGMRRCSRCNETLPFAQFYKRSDGPTGLSSRCSSCIKEVSAQLAKDNPGSVAITRKRLKRLWRFGMTEDEWNDYLAWQEHRCAICRQPESMVKNSRIVALSIDHCHETGHVRGLLCARCNQALGMFKDEPLLLLSALQYLDDHRGRKAVGHIWKTDEQLDRLRMTSNYT